MKILKLNGVKLLSKNDQQRINGGWSSNDKNACMASCMSQPNSNSYDCAIACCVIQRIGVNCG